MFSVIQVVLAQAAQNAQQPPDPSVAWGAIVLAVVTGVTGLVTLMLNLRHDKKIAVLQTRNDQCEADREEDRREVAELTTRLARHERLAKRRRKRTNARVRQRLDELEQQLSHKKDATDGHTPLPGTAPHTPLPPTE